MDDIKIINTCLEHCFGGCVGEMVAGLKVSRQSIYNWRKGINAVNPIALALATELLKKKGKYHYVTK